MLCQAVSVGRRVAALQSILIFYLSTLGSFCGYYASGVTLAWDPCLGPAVVGYNLYYGAASANYTNTVPVVNATSVTVTNLVAGTVYYFAVTAIDSFGLESNFSSEAVFINRPRTPPVIVTGDGVFGLVTNRFGFNITGSPGQDVVVEASTNLLQWFPLQTNTLGSSPLYFSDPGWRQNPCRFYRARLR